MGNDNLERNPKSEPKKFSRLCTFKEWLSVYGEAWKVVRLYESPRFESQTATLTWNLCVYLYVLYCAQKNDFSKLHNDKEKR